MVPAFPNPWPVIGFARIWGLANCHWMRRPSLLAWSAAAPKHSLVHLSDKEDGKYDEATPTETDTPAMTVLRFLLSAPRNAHRIDRSPNPTMTEAKSAPRARHEYSDDTRSQGHDAENDAAEAPAMDDENRRDRRDHRLELREVQSRVENG